MKSKKSILKKMMLVVMVLTLLLSVACKKGEDGDTEVKDDKAVDSSEESKEEKVQSDTKKDEESKEEKDDTYHVGFSLPTMQFPFYVRMNEGFEEAAAERGWEVTFVDGNLDAQRQVNGCLDLISSGVDALVYATWFPDAMIDVHDEAAKKGIPVFMMDQSFAPDAEFVMTTGTDNKDAGYIGGLWAANYIKENLGKDEINLVNVTWSSETSMARNIGFQEGLEAGGLKVNLLQDFIADTREKSMTVTEDALVSHQDIDIIFGYSAQSSLGAYDACMAANRNEILIMGFDGEDDEIKLIDEDTQYIGTVVQFPAEMSKFVAECIDKYEAGETLDQVIPFEAGVYSLDGVKTADEINELYK